MPEIDDKPTSSSPSKRRFQRLRVRSLSRPRTKTKPVAESEDYSPNGQMNRRNNSTGNLHMIDPPTHRTSVSGSLSRASRSTLNLIQNAPRNTLRHLSKSLESLARMGDGKYVHIVLLDGRQIEVYVQPTLRTEELLDIVASHFNLKEKEYFGFSFHDDLGHYNWLQSDRRVLEHDFSVVQKKHKFIVLYFMVKFFAESITHLRDPVTVELFYLQARILVVQDLIQPEQENAFELAAYVLQACFGDFVDLESTRAALQKQPVLSQRIWKQAASVEFCEERIADYYQKLAGLPKGNAIVNYMSIVESLSTYGIHYYAVTDKSGGSYYLGISHKGLGQYKHDDKKVPERVFLWKDLGNLFYRDKKFSAEVLEARRVVHALSSINLYEDAIEEPVDQYDDLSTAIADPTTQVSVSRRTFAPGQLSVHVWFAATAALAKAVWTMAINQHQFYLERKQQTHSHGDYRSRDEIASELNESVSLLHICDPLRPRSVSQCSNDNIRIIRDGSLTSGFSSDDGVSQMSDLERKEVFTQARTRKAALEAKLLEKMRLLKELCMKEAQITGELPSEIHSALAPGEEAPKVRRKMGTTFELVSGKVDTENMSQEDKDFADLELSYEVQVNITKAAEKLMKDAGGKAIRKQRKQEYRKAHAKLKELEKQLKELRMQRDRDNPSFESQEFQISHSSSMSSGLGDSSSLQSLNRPPHSPSMSLRSSTHSHSSISIPDLANSVSSRSVSNNSLRPGTGPFVANSVYQTRNAYRVQQYPTLNSNSSNSSPMYKKHEAYSALSESHIGSPSPQKLPEKSSESYTEGFTQPADPVRPNRAISLDRSRAREVNIPVIVENDAHRYATLDQRRSRHQQPLPPPTGQPPPKPMVSHMPAVSAYTSELTKPYEMADYYKYSHRVRKLNRTTPEEVDSVAAPSPVIATKLHALSPSPVAASGNVRQYCYAAATSSASLSSGASTPSNRTTSPKYPMMPPVQNPSGYLPPRSVQCMPALQRSARETQISWNDDGMPKTPTIV